MQKQMLTALIIVRQLLLTTAKWLHIKATNISLFIKINIKWVRDCMALPLTSDHYELYFIIHKYYYSIFNKFPDLINCPDYNDKIQWLKLFDQQELVVQCCDKIGVRDYVKETLGKDYCVPLFAVADCYDAIDFNNLPDRFVIKANHDVGSVTLVTDKSAMNHVAIRKKMEDALGRSHGWSFGEWGYAFIRPRLLVESYLETPDGLSPPDYKFHCVEGRVIAMQYIYDRWAKAKEQMIDRNGNDMNMHFVKFLEPGKGFQKPVCWNEMVSLAEKLAINFKYVRVDLYLVSGRIYLGEMTFWPMAGTYRGDGQRIFGQFMNFSRNTYREPVYKALGKNHCV